MAHTLGNSTQRKRLYENISCITFDAGSSEYELRGLSYFDVPNQPYVEGCLTGTLLVSEILKEAAQDDSFDSLPNVIKEAAKFIDVGGGGPDIESKRGAAVGLFGTLQEVLNFAASRLDFTEVFKSCFDCCEADLTEQLEDMRKNHAVILAGIAANASQARPQDNAG